jgi:gluconate 2-dehydrogenase gamma chain
MSEFSRRDVLCTGSALGVTVALGSFASAQSLVPEAAGYVFFSEDEAAFIEAAVDRLIPPDSEWPGARDAGVPIYIDRQLAGPYGSGARLYLAGPIKRGLPGQGYQLGLTPAELYRTALRTIAEELARRNLDFTSAPGDQQDAFLGRLERGELVIDGFSAAIFFETLLANTIEGFFADPAYGGNKDMVSWRMIGFPGAYAAYLDVYTHHGLHFDREPLPMATTHPHDHGARVKAAEE